MDTPPTTQMMMCLSKAITERLSDLDHQIDRLKTFNSINDLSLSTTPIYSIKQVCLKTGLSRYRLKVLWDKYKLPIPKPERGKGYSPRYSAKDIAIIREALCNRNV